MSALAQARFYNDAKPISYVYVLSDEQGTPRYVGMGRGGRELQSCRERGLKPLQRYERLTNDQAKQVEAILIEILGVEDHGGLLENVPKKRRACRPYHPGRAARETATALVECGFVEDGAFFRGACRSKLTGREFWRSDKRRTSRSSAKSDAEHASLCADVLAMSAVSH